MKLYNYNISGLLEFMSELFSIDEYYASKGNSKQDNVTREGRVQLGANASSVLSTVQVSFTFRNMTIFDVETMRNIATSIEILNGYQSDFIMDDENTISDLREYRMEAHSIIPSVTDEYPKEAAKLTSVGCYKFLVIVIFRGNDILSLFNGFLENYIYRHFKSVDEIQTETADIDLRRYMLKNLMENFMKASYQASAKPSLIEDYIINTEYYSYIPQNEDIVSLADILHACGKIRFFGAKDSNEVLESVEQYKEALNKKDSAASFGFENLIFTFACTSSIPVYIILKLYGEGINIIANQKYDIPYSDENINFKLSPDCQRTFGIRINSMIAHNIQARKVVIKDVGTETNLGHPSNRYGLIFNGQKIKYVVQIKMSDLKTARMKDFACGDETIDGLFEQAGDIIRKMTIFGKSIAESHLNIKAWEEQS